MNEAVYAIGDIHGHLEKLCHAHDLIARDKAANGLASASVIHIGDLVDRGPDSRGVIEYLIAKLDSQRNWVVLRGNHDQLFRLFLSEGVLRDDRLKPQFTWLHPRLGGLDTLASYGVEIDQDDGTLALAMKTRNAVPDHHVRFLESLPYFWTAPGLFFAHAGIRPGVALDKQDPGDLIWIRDEFHDSRANHGALIVHGHTPVDKATHYGNRINIDSGAGMGRDLTTIVIEGGRCFVLSDTGRIPLLPA